MVGHSLQLDLDEHLLLINTNWIIKKDYSEREREGMEKRNSGAAVKSWLNQENDEENHSGDIFFQQCRIVRLKDI